MDRVNRKMLVLITKPFYDKTLLKRGQKIKTLPNKRNILRIKGKTIETPIKRGIEIVDNKYGVIIEIPKRKD